MAGKFSQAPADEQLGADSGNDASARLARSLAQTVEKCHDLATVIDAWPGLSKAVKAGIMAMIKAAREVT